jgi:hypothetical protein
VHVVNDAQGRYSFACVVTGAETRVFVVEATLAELSSPDLDIGEPTTGLSVSGGITGLRAGDVASIALSRRSATAAGPAYTVARVPAGQWDLVALRSDFATGEMRADRAYLVRGLTVQADLNAPVDLAGAASFETETYAVSVGNRSADPTATARTEVNLHTAGQTRAQTGLGSGDAVYAALPVVRQLGDDTYVARGYEDTNGGLGRRSRSISFKLPGPMTLDLGPSLTGAYVDDGAYAGPGLRFVAHWNPIAGADAYAVLLGQFGGVDLIWECIVTPGRLAGAASYAVPTLGGLAGWQSAWDLTSGELDWSIEATNAGPTLAAALTASVRGTVPSGLSITSTSVSGRNASRATGASRLRPRFLRGL